MLHKTARAQAAVDFLLSYGIALIIITIAIAIIYKITTTSPNLSSYTCAASPGFSCDFYALTANTGVLTIKLSQATGGAIVINGAACSSQVNSTGIGPKYGNAYVTNSMSFYPAGNAPTNGISAYSGSSATLKLYCYYSNGSPVGPLGSVFVGYLWLNYTIPNYGKTILQVASINIVYT